jgi:hypothetical protein
MKRLGILLMLLGLSLAVTPPAGALPPSCSNVCEFGWSKPCTCGPVVTYCTGCAVGLSLVEEPLCPLNG